MAEDNPLHKAAEAMKPEKMRRFYKSVTWEYQDDGYVVLLDGKPIRTPGKKLVAVRHEAIADKLVNEWDAQKENIDAAKMPLTRIVNSAIDGVTGNTSQVADEIGNYVTSDLICYRADEPKELAKRQSEHWDPVKRWAEKHFNMQLRCATGIMHVEQPQSTVKSIRNALSDFDSVELAALHAVTTISGSILLALAMANGVLSDSQTWDAAFVDENWNIEKWGEDEENKKVMAFKRAEFDAACVILDAGRGKE